MSKPFLIFLILLLSSFSFHKYYVSVSEIYIKKDKIQIIIRTFPDDMERAIEENFHIKESDDNFSKYLEIYIKENFLIYIDNKEINYSIIGTTLEDNYQIILIELNIPKAPQNLQIQNSILTDIFPKQKNIVHILKNKKKLSFILNKQQTNLKIDL